MEAKYATKFQALKETYQEQYEQHAIYCRGYPSNTQSWGWSGACRSGAGDHIGMPEWARVNLRLSWTSCKLSEANDIAVGIWERAQMDGNTTTVDKTNGMDSQWACLQCERHKASMKCTRTLLGLLPSCSSKVGAASDIAHKPRRCELYVQIGFAQKAEAMVG